MLKQPIHFLYFFLFFIWCISVKGQVNSVGKLETAFLYHFGENIEWENQANFKAYEIYYVGENPEVINGLKALSEHKTIKSKPIKVAHGNQIYSIPECHILFIDPIFNSQLKSLFEEYKNKNVLIVTQDYPDDNLVMVNFLTNGGNKLKIRIKNENLVRKKLIANSDLMIYGGNEIDRAKIYQEWKKSLNLALDSLENERSKAKAFEKEISTLKSEIQTTQDTLDRKQKEVESSNEVIANLETTIGSQESKLLQIGKDLDANQSALIQKQEEIALEDQKINQLQAKVNKTMEAIAKNDEILKTQQSTIKDQKGKIDLSTQQVKEKDVTIAKQRMIVFVSIAAVLIISGLIFLVLRASKLKEIAFTKLKAKNAEILEQRAQLQSQAEELTAINEQINLQKTELQQTLDELRTTQSQLVLAEKMAMLGQTAAGIAHEINTPLGAINSSAENIINYYHEYARTFLQMLNTVEQDLLPMYFDMVMSKPADKVDLSTRELRQIRKRIAAELESSNHPKPMEMAEYIVDLGIFEEVEKYRPLIDSKDHDFIFKSANNAKQLLLSSRNIIAAVQRASKIIVTLKTYARKDKIDYKEQVNLKENILTVLIIYHNQLKNYVVKKTLPNLSKPLYAYADELGQIWTNLIHNAIHAMGNNGKLEIAYEEREDSVLICVKDNGSGIPQAIQNQVFEPLFTTKKDHEGTGLGLDIVRKIVDKHGGKIYFTSKEGVGTSFFVELPLNMEMAAV